MIKLFDKSLVAKEVVVCIECGKAHELDAETFVTFYGNVMIGLHGGVVGNNFNEDGTLLNATIYCRNTYCLKTLIEQFTNNVY